MRMPRRVADRAARSRPVAILAFIYLPIAIIVLYSFNAAARRAWPITGLHARLVRRGARQRGRPRRRSSTSLEAARRRDDVALVLGIAASRSRSQRYAFFGRETISFLVVLPLALPGIVTGIALNTAFRTIGIPTSGC